GQLVGAVVLVGHRPRVGRRPHLAPVDLLRHPAGRVVAVVVVGERRAGAVLVGDGRDAGGVVVGVDRADHYRRGGQAAVTGDAGQLVPAVVREVHAHGAPGGVGATELPAGQPVRVVVDAGQSPPQRVGAQGRAVGRVEGVRQGLAEDVGVAPD